MELKSLLILGAGGMVGSALNRAAQDRGYAETLTPSSRDLDLTSQSETHAYLAEHRPDQVIVAAAKVGGIHANSTYPAEFIYKNLMIAANAVEGSYQAGVKELLFLGSSCIYPKMAPQPMPESCLLTSELEPTNEAYAVAKIAGLKLCQHYRAQYGVKYHSAMPTNLYGPGDNYHPENSHVIPAMIRRFHEAKESAAESVTIWGTGIPRREFLYVDDLADACFHLMALENPPDWVNVGYGEDITILELAQAVARAVGFTGAIETDPSKPDGTPRKLMDNSILRSLDWQPSVALEQGLKHAYQNFLDSEQSGTVRAV
ncbi:GDP-L-fucose synthase [Verrucomicrobiaceae bacterium 5K15]|uniref:GDP-L-fucose synthase n=1 Tax=Oceaniferula flava TaxID=2800421 RepID=A0AAE2VF37_9BACT|nr:GDP-L-fucose synthase [Oceaniferula flavus]MBK1856559.1 GDP-L-fucose synthase [Oceaniferula flavus]MBM1137866.1 GDP-L-fucose synthase [Oceaniferula flavus]